MLLAHGNVVRLVFLAVTATSTTGCTLSTAACRNVLCNTADAGGQVRLTTLGAQSLGGNTWQRKRAQL